MTSTTQPSFELESQYHGVVAGVDEAGRGPWAGPVVAGACILDPAHVPEGLNDSKKLTAKKREIIFEKLMQHEGHQCAVAIVEADVIDQLNILQATKLAMRNAVEKLNPAPQVVLIDGNQPPALPTKTVAVIKGDAISLSIAAASVLAKVTRDRIMHQLHEQFPHFGWNSNAGYGAKAHQEGLALHGITPHHRRSYAPIRKIIEASLEPVE